MLRALYPPPLQCRDSISGLGGLEGCVCDGGVENSSVYVRRHPYLTHSRGAWSAPWRKRHMAQPHCRCGLKRWAGCRPGVSQAAMCTFSPVMSDVSARGGSRWRSAGDPNDSALQATDARGQDADDDSSLFVSTMKSRWEEFVQFCAQFAVQAVSPIKAYSKWFDLGYLRIVSHISIVTFVLFRLHTNTFGMSITSQVIGGKHKIGHVLRQAQVHSGRES